MLQYKLYPVFASVFILGCKLHKFKLNLSQVYIEIQIFIDVFYKQAPFTVIYFEYKLLRGN